VAQSEDIVAFGSFVGKRQVVVVEIVVLMYVVLGQGDANGR